MAGPLLKTHKGIRYHLMTPSDVNGAAELASEIFPRFVEICRILTLGEKDYVQYFRRYFERSALEELGVIAIAESGEMVGAAIGDDFNNPRPPGISHLASANEGMRALTALRKEMESYYRAALDDETNSAKRKILLLKTGAVQPRYMNKDMGTMLAQLVCECAMRKGFEMATCRATGNASVRLYEKLGFKKVKIVEYATWTPDGGKTYPLKAARPRVARYQVALAKALKPGVWHAPPPVDEETVPRARL